MEMLLRKPPENPVYEGHKVNSKISLEETKEEAAPSEESPKSSGGRKSRRLGILPTLMLHF